MFFILFYPREYDKYGHVTINVEGNILHSQNIPTAKRDWVILYKRCYLCFTNQIFKQHILLFHHTPNHGSCLQVHSHIFSKILRQTCQGLWMVEAELRLEATVQEATEGQVGQLTFGRFSCEKLISALSYPDHWLPRCLLACFFFTFSRFSYLKGLHNSTQNLTQGHLRWRYHRWLLDT